MRLGGGVTVKKLLLAGFAVSAWIAPALAADMPVPAPAPLWTGFYIGANGGYALSMDGVIRSRGVYNICTDLAVIGCAGSIFNPPNTYGLASAQAATFNTSKNNNGGFLGGGQFGDNYQFGTSSVIGLEADLQGVFNSNHTVTLASVTPAVGFPAFPVNQTATVSSKLDYLGTLRARAGYLWTPELLLYITGGLAYGEVELNSTITQNVAAPPNFTPYTGVGSISALRFGGTVGAGLEWMLARNWSVRAEYLYVGLNTQNVTSNLVNTDHVFGGSLSSVAVVTSARFTDSIARGAVNYHF